MTGRRRGRGEGAISKRSDGRWMGRVDLGWQAGRRRYKAVYGKTRRDVADKICTVREKLQRGTLPTNDRTTVGDWLAYWLTAIVKTRVRPATYESYEAVVRLHIVPHLGRVPLSALRPERVEQWFDELAAVDVSASRCRYGRVVLRTALNRAIKQGLVATNAAGLADAPAVTTSDVMPFDREQVRTLLKYAAKDRLGALFAVVVACGLRQGEVLGLQWSDVDLRARELHVRRQLRWRRERFVLESPKSAKSVRMVALLPMVVDELAKHRARQGEERLRAGDNWTQIEYAGEDKARASEYVFTTPLGAPLVRYTVIRQFHKLLKRAKLPTIRFHDLRHTSATLLLLGGVPLPTVSAILGHSGIQITADTYGHVLKSMKHDAAEKLAQVIGG